MDMYFFFFCVSSSRNEKRKKKEKKKRKTKKKNAGIDLGYCPKQCHDTMENCIVTWPLDVQWAGNCIATRGRLGEVYCKLVGW